MDTNVKGIFFDLGGTLRMCHHVPYHEERAKRRMAALSGLNPEDPEAFYQMIEQRYKPYRDEIFVTNREAGDFELWHKWLLPEMDEEHLKEVCHEITYQYRQCAGLRCLTEGGMEVVRELFERGYKLGIISNLIGETEIANWVRDSGLAPFFDIIVVSAKCGLRKPGHEIYELACERLGVPPQQCVSVADNLDRDILGAKKAGIYKNILYISKEKLAKKTITEENAPDYIVHTFPDILNLDMFN